jgi:hypothetical protein
MLNPRYEPRALLQIARPRGAPREPTHYLISKDRESWFQLHKGGATHCRKPRLSRTLTSKHTAACSMFGHVSIPAREDPPPSRHSECPVVAPPAFCESPPAILWKSLETSNTHERCFNRREARRPLAQLGRRALGRRRTSPLARLRKLEGCGPHLRPCARN